MTFYFLSFFFFLGGWLLKKKRSDGWMDGAVTFFFSANTNGL
jgi:hypothetical protein